MTTQALTVVNAEQFSQLTSKDAAIGLLDIIQGLGGFGTLMQYRIKIPSGGGRIFTIETIDGEVHLPKFEAVILSGWPNQRAWNRLSYDDSPGGPPDCASTDGVRGFGRRGLGEDAAEEPATWQDCATCKWGQFGSGNKGRGKACRDSAVLWLMRPGAGLPQPLTVPATSLKVVKDYQIKMAMANVMPFQVLTEVSLESDESQNGQKYSKLILRRVGTVPPEVHEGARQMAQAIKQALLERRPYVAGMDAADTSWDFGAEESQPSNT